MARDTRALRLKFVWLLVLPFLWFARPTLSLLAWGAPLAVLGLLLRAWAAGTIVKERELTTTGPYSHLRHPLYLGSLFIGAVGDWASLPTAIALLFLLLVPAGICAWLLPPDREHSAEREAAG